MYIPFAVVATWKQFHCSFLEKSAASTMNKHHGCKNDDQRMHFATDLNKNKRTDMHTALVEYSLLSGAIKMCYIVF